MRVEFSFESQIQQGGEKVGSSRKLDERMSNDAQGSLRKQRTLMKRGELTG